MKLTPASGATALGSAGRASLIYQTDPLRFLNLRLQAVHENSFLVVREHRLHLVSV
jgi:hypothetical protein